MGFPMKMLLTESDIGSSSRKFLDEEDRYAVGNWKCSFVFEDDFRLEIQNSNNGGNFVLI